MIQLRNLSSLHGQITHLGLTLMEHCNQLIKRRILTYHQDQLSVATYLRVVTKPAELFKFSIAHKKGACAQVYRFWLHHPAQAKTLILSTALQQLGKEKTLIASPLQVQAEELCLRMSNFYPDYVLLLMHTFPNDASHLVQSGTMHI